MVVGQHDEGGSRPAPSRTISSGTGVSRVSIPGAAMPSSALGARLDDDRPHRQQRKCRRQRLADMAAAEDQTCGRRAALGLGRLRSAVPLGVVEQRDRRASTRPPQHWPISGPSGMSRRRWRSARRASIARALSIAMNSSWPPPMVPRSRPARPASRRPASRGVEPFASRFDEAATQRRGRRHGSLAEGWSQP